MRDICRDLLEILVILWQGQRFLSLVLILLACLLVSSHQASYALVYTLF